MKLTPQGDQERIETRYNYLWIHNVMGHFVKDTMDYFADYLYPRFGDWKVIGTYDKAVEYLNKQIQFAKETDQPMLPALICDPSGDFELDETYGKMLYRFPNLSPGFAKYVWTPIYQDSNVIITVGFGRIVGQLNFTALLSSFYEYIDMKLYLNMIFGGKDRFIYPQWFNSFIILPEEISNYEYVNSVTGETYKINLDDSYNQLIKTTNTDELVYPCRILPRYKLTEMSDASTRLGGVENLPEWKLNFTLNYELEAPVFIILDSDYLVENIKATIKYESCYTANKTYTTVGETPDNIISFDVNVAYGLDSTGTTEITYPEETTINNHQHRTFKTRYYHIVSQSEVDSTSTVEVTIPEVVNDKNLLRLNGKHGNFAYGDNYIISEDGTTLIINKEHVTLELGDIIEIYIYKYEAQL